MEAPVLSAPTSPPVARALLRGDLSHPQLVGETLFFPYGRGTLVVARVLGLPSPGFHGFHIHEKGDCSTGGDVPFAQAGGHYDPKGASHPWHAGDLPPLLASSDGTALLAVYTDRFQPAEVVGRSVIVHDMPDDLHSQPAGNSGTRIACGIIEAV